MGAGGAEALAAVVACAPAISIAGAFVNRPPVGFAELPACGARAAEGAGKGVTTGGPCGGDAQHRHTGQHTQTNQAPPAYATSAHRPSPPHAHPDRAARAGQHEAAAAKLPQRPKDKLYARQVRARIQAGPIRRLERFSALALAESRPGQRERERRRDLSATQPALRTTAPGTPC